LSGGKGNPNKSLLASYPLTPFPNGKGDKPQTS
jgi:hypothetical protein